MSEVRPNVLVLMASFNGRQWLSDQLQSILSQEGVGVSLWVSDDASSDGTRELLSQVCQADPRVNARFYTQGSGSAGANFRRLFSSAEIEGYDFVALADQDDIWHPRKLASAVDELRRTGAQGYSCAVEAFGSGGRRHLLKQSKVITAADFLFEGAGQGCSFVIPAAIFCRVQQFCIEHSNAAESLHYHDWLIYLLVRAWGGVWLFDSASWVSYRQHGGNEIGSRAGLGAALKRIEKIRVGWYKKQILAALEIFRLASKKNQVVNKFCGILSMPNSPYRGFKLSLFVLVHGRRRRSDRLVLVLAAMLNWI